MIIVIVIITNKYQLQDSRLHSTPMETNLKIEKAEICESDIKYRNLIGALLYISPSTRPDISYSVNYLSRYQNSYNETHWKYALRILKYLYLTFRLPGFEPLNGLLKVAKLLSCITYQLYTKFMSEVEPIYRLSGSLKVN